MAANEKVLRKIQKCLRLSESSNPHEAAAALRQARALMEAHGVTEAQAELSDIREADVQSTGKSRVPRWEAGLCDMVATSLGCRVLFQHGERTVGRSRDGQKSGRMVFVGAGAAPDIAAYAFAVLRRKMHAALKALRSGRGHLDAAGRDAFCMGWVFAVREKVKGLVPPDGTLERVDRALQERNPEMAEAKTRDASGLGKGDKSRLGFVAAGFREGSAVDLHQGVGGMAQRAGIEVAP